MILLLPFLALGAAFAWVFWASGGFSRHGEYRREVRGPALSGSGKARAGSSESELRVLSWNISYGYGPGSDGLSFRPRALQENLERLDAIAERIRACDADVVMLQEVDFGSDRSGRVDQLRRIQERTGYEYAAPAVSWDARYVPYPYWPPSAHFGRVLSGGGILSRFPIVSNRVGLFEKPAENPWVYNLFYLHRYYQAVGVEGLGPPGRVRTLFNVHLEAFQAQARQRQAADLGRAARAAGSSLLCLAGDFNTLPPFASRKRGFPDQPGMDYALDGTYEIFRRESGMVEAVPESLYLATEESFLTYPSPAPDRRLDYCWIGQGLDVKEARTESVGTLSDHRAFLARLSVR